MSNPYRYHSPNNSRPLFGAGMLTQYPIFDFVLFLPSTASCFSPGFSAVEFAEKVSCCLFPEVEKHKLLK